MILVLCLRGFFICDAAILVIVVVGFLVVGCSAVLISYGTVFFLVVC